MKEFKNILLVSGSGRNIGKTTLACSIISQVKSKSTVYGFKISPHFHQTGSNQQIVVKGDGFSIFREKDMDSDKDSSRMLRAGAQTVYFAQCDDAHISCLYNHILRLLPAGSPVVCESGSFASIFKPGLHLVVRGDEVDESKKTYKLNLKRADLVIESEMVIENNLNHSIDFIDNHWLIESSY